MALRNRVGRGGAVIALALAAFAALATDTLCASLEEAGKREVERYRYEAMPEGNFDESLREVVDMEFVTTADRVEYNAKITMTDRTDRIRVVTDDKGRFVFALKASQSGSKSEVRKVWRDEHKVYMGEVGWSTRNAKSFDLPEDHPLAVDASLLILLRSFPFDTGSEWKLFMVDFSGLSTTVTVRQDGIEGVASPEGTFDCYRMEVVIDIPVFRPKITYWLTKKSPHFLVKHRGKRGPFTLSYLTSLVAVE